MSAQITIYDTTLRDGCQGAGIALSLRDKLLVARHLDEIHVDYVEGGWPGSNPKDRSFFEALRVEPLGHARLSAFGSTRKPGTRPEHDDNLRLLVDSGTPVVTVVAKTSDFHVSVVLRTTLEENLAMIRESVAFLKAHGREVVVDAEHFFDGYRRNRDYALHALEAAADGGAGWLVLADTNGGSMPGQIAEATTDVVARFDVPVGIHTHDDAGLAVANALAAVESGARQVQGTVNGYGERVGNANLCTVIPDLVLKLGYRCSAGDRLDRLTELSRFVDRAAGVGPNPRLPFVGEAAFAHKGGLHVHAIARDPTTYEHVDPALVGNRRRVLVSELSGRNNVVERARELGLELDADSAAARALTQKVKELESDGFHFEDAEASFDLLVRRFDPAYVPPFEPREYLVQSTKAETAEATHSRASAEVAVGGEVLRSTALGGGPVDALERALRRTLEPAYPQLAHIALVDFQAQVVGGGGDDRAPIRVRLTAKGADRVWTTVGSAGDILHATWLALADSLEYAVATGVGATDAAGLRAAPMSLDELAEILVGELGDDDRAVLAALAATDWREETLDLASSADRALAAHATSLGAALFYSFANFCAVAAPPALESVQRVNLLKGRPINQVGSITTTRDRLERCFAWELVPEPLDRERVLALMDDFFALGPMGFRGPAADRVPDHLTSLDGAVRTTQMIAPGYRCPSNDLLTDVLERIGEDFVFVTSANVSSGLTGRIEAAHYDLAGIQDDFGDRDGIVLIGHRDEAAVRASYPRHVPMSTSILAFHKLAGGADGRPAIVLERHGSLDVEPVRALVERHGLALQLGSGAVERLPARDVALAESQ